MERRTAMTVVPIAQVVLALHLRVVHVAEQRGQDGALRYALLLHVELAAETHDVLEQVLPQQRRRTSAIHRRIYHAVGENLQRTRGTIQAKAHRHR